MNRKELKELLDFDGKNFIWRERKPEQFNGVFYKDNIAKIWNKRYSGKKAGTIHIDDYGNKRTRISIKSKKYYQKKLIKLWNGEINEY